MRASDSLLRDLTPSQREAVLHEEGPLLVVAGPGSGKTRVITRRVAHLVAVRGVPAHGILAITFTNKAAEEMSRRVAEACPAEGAWVRTFHSTCAAILRRWPRSAGLEPGFTIYDGQDQGKVVRQALRELDVPTQTLKPGAALSAISHWKTDGVSPEEAAKDAWNEERRARARVYEAYARALADNNAVDFDDLLLLTLRAIEQDEPLRLMLQERFRHVLIDEYQDTSPVQFHLARHFAARTRNLCATGDPDQSIYAFRKADLRNILDFEEHYPGARVVRLEENFRSVGTVLRAADALISHNRDRRPKRLVCTREAGLPIRIVSTWTERDEGNAVADAILAAYGRGVPYRDIAVFYRVNAQSRSLEAGLRSRGIPYQILKGVEFYQRAEIKDLLAYLKVLANPSDRESMARVLATPSRGIGRVSLERLARAGRAHGWNAREALRRAADTGEVPSRAAAAMRGVAEMLDLLERGVTGSVAALLRETIRLVQYETYLRSAYEEDAEERLANVDELLVSAVEYDQESGADGSVQDFLMRVGLVSDQDRYDPDTPRVPLMTLHTAKGLEFREVILAGLEEGLLPHARSADDPKALEEERRLFFVGITRAKERLTLTYTLSRMSHIQGGSTGESRFLRELPDEVLEWDRSGGPAAVPAGLGGSWRRREAPSTAPWDDADAVPEYTGIDEDPSLALRVNQGVSHPVFGEGRIRRLTGRGPGARVVVFFPGRGEKTLAVTQARLTPLD